MAALETRLLLLGAVSIFEPVNGYQLRRELTTWHVHEWANIAPGSIYNGLATLAKRGDLTRHDLKDESRDVAVYEVTEQGRAEFLRLFEQAMATVTPTMPIAFHTALSMLPMVTRKTARRLILLRLEKLDELRRRYTEGDELLRSTPPHVTALTTFWSRLGEVEYEWLTQLASRIGDGALDFAGEEPSWTPDADDPGWQIAADRERYLALLGRTPTA